MIHKILEGLTLTIDRVKSEAKSVMRSFHLIIFFRLELPHLTSISMPIDETNNKIKLRLAEENRNGWITLRELIVPEAFTKLTMENNKLEREDFEVSGRRMPLTFIRKKMLADHKKLMKLRADQEFQNMTREEIISAMDEINKFS